MPDVLGIESSAGDLLAVRYLGAAYRIEPLAIDPAVPMWLVGRLDSYSGADDHVTLFVIGLLDGELRSLLEVAAGPRSNVSPKDYIGPPGTIAPSGKGALRIRSADRNAEPYCFPGLVAGDGCHGAERVDTWDPSKRAFTKGSEKPVVLKQEKPNGPTTVTPR